MSIATRTRDKCRSSHLTIKDCDVDNSAKWSSSHEGAMDDSLNSFSHSELKLIILCARDREKTQQQISNNINILNKYACFLTKKIGKSN